MKGTNRTDDGRWTRKALISMLAAVIMVMVAIPSFAVDGNGDIGQQQTEATEQLQQTEATEQLQQTEATEQLQQTEQEETAAGPEEGAVSEETHAAEPESVEAAINSEPPAVKLKAAAPKKSSAMPENNTKVDYSSSGSHPVKFTVKHDGYTFKGTCATLGVDNAKSGKATVKRVSNNSRIAKLVYYYGYKKGWWVGKNSSKKATTVLGFTDKNCTENAKQCIEALIQRNNMGWTDFWNARKVGKYRMYSTDSFMREINSLYNKDVSDITIPDDVVFEMFHGETSSSKQQDFYVWRYKTIPNTQNGYVAVEKLSADESITN